METASALSVGDLPEAFNAADDLLLPNLRLGRADKVAFIDEAKSTTYGELAAKVERMAVLLDRLGVRTDQRVLLCLEDTVDFVVAFLGAIRAGVIPVPLNTLLTANDYAWIHGNSAAAAVFVSKACAGQWLQVAASHPQTRFLSSRGGPWDDLDELIEATSPGSGLAATHRDDVAFWLYTSGSTGRPKAAMHTHASMRLTANLFAGKVLELRVDDVVLSVAKLFFAYGLGNALTFPLSVGATAVLHRERPTPDAISDLVVQHGVSVLCGVPTFFGGWFAGGAAPARSAVPRLRLATSAGEGLPAHLGCVFHERFGADVIDGLGSTEMLHVYLSQRPGEVRYGCTGRPVPGYEVKIVDDQGREVGPGEVGELLVRGPTAATGYWRDRISSRATFQGEWTRTGDIYSRDGDGWYTFGGRRDDLLKVGGVYVSPSEIEEVLLDHAAVLEAAVVGVADENGLIKPCAHVVLRDSTQAGAALEAELKRHVKAKLAPYKYPRRIVFTAALPRTATGKIQRFRLREVARPERS